MGASSLIPDENQIRDIKRETGFSKEQLHRLYSRFIALDKQSEGRLRREDLERIPELYVNPISQFLLDAFFRDRQEINFLEFVELLAIFRPCSEPDSAEPDAWNSRSAKMRFLFDLYDTDRDGVITPDEIYRMLDELMGRHERPHQVQAIANRIVREAVADYRASGGGESVEDDCISFAVFTHAMRGVDDHQLSICFVS